MTNWSNCPDVESNPEIVSGAYVVRGSRIPADAVIDNAAAYGPRNRFRSP